MQKRFHSVFYSRLFTEKSCEWRIAFNELYTNSQTEMKRLYSGRLPIDPFQIEWNPFHIQVGLFIVFLPICLSFILLFILYQLNTLGFKVFKWKELFFSLGWKMWLEEGIVLGCYKINIIHNLINQMLICLLVISFINIPIKYSLIKYVYVYIIQNISFLNFI